MPQLVLPDSTLLNDEARTALALVRQLQSELNTAEASCPSVYSVDCAQVPSIRERLAHIFYDSRLYRRLRDRYAVTVAPREINGVYTEVFTPSEGIEPGNAHRVLINLHGGGFEAGSRTTSHLESIPIAAVGRIKVIAIDYRMAPEHAFPAASQDVAAVYRELLKEYAPQNIGIYGCSAGSLLTSQVVAWFQKEGLPRPGAVGMFCAAGCYYGEGDSGYYFAMLTEYARSLVADAQTHAYFRNTDPKDPLAFPMRSREIVAKFPPSLLMTSTRDQALSSVVQMRCLLLELGVHADLHIWEGLDHAFHTYADLPQSRQFYDIAVQFFDRWLGKS